MFINAPSLPCVFKNDIDTHVLTKEILVHVHLIVYMYQWLFNQVQGKSPG